MLTATDSTGTTTFTYDPVTQLLTEVAYPNNLYLQFTYNSAGQRTQMIDQTGFTVNYAYRLAMADSSALTDGSGNRVVTYTYDANGRLSLKTNGNGTYTTYQYDADGNILHLINYAPGGAINSRFDYTYNALGLETTEATLDGAWTYTYDADGQLTLAVFALRPTPEASPKQNLAYNYDAMGNRTSTVINGVTTAYTTNELNEYTSVSGVAYTYDADGNLTSDGTNTYTYNSLNQLIGLSGANGTTTYGYDALGQQANSTANGQNTEYLVDPFGLGDVVGQYASGGSLVANYAYGLGLSSQVTASATYYYDFDALGSTVGLTNGSGGYVDRYEYLPFGGNLNSAQTIPNALQFVGEVGVSSVGAGLIAMGARSYSTGSGRFESQDPLGLFSGEVNPYRYVYNSPMVLVDPQGLKELSIDDKAQMTEDQVAHGMGGDVETTYDTIKEYKDNTKTVLGSLLYNGSTSLTKAVEAAILFLAQQVGPVALAAQDLGDRYSHRLDPYLVQLGYPPVGQYGGNSLVGGLCTQIVSADSSYQCDGETVTQTSYTTVIYPCETVQPQR